GFPGDKRNAFTRGGRTKEEQEVFEHIQKLTSLRAEFEPLRRGQLVNLYVSEQQYAYARTSRSGTVVTVINNHTKAAEIVINVMPVGLGDGEVLVDRLGVSQPVRVAERRLRVALPARSAAIFVRQ
ncbi:MAG: hypothetical protein ACREA9_26070, partial [Pyrinomonadaceae bacterium]